MTFGQRFNTNWQGMKDAFRGTGMWAIFTVSAVRGMADRTYVFLVPLYLAYLLERDGYEILDPYVVTLLAVHVALMTIPGIISGPIIGAISDRIGRKLIIVFVMALTTCLTLATVMSAQIAGGFTPMITLLIAIYGTFNFSVNNLTQAAAADIAVGRRLESSFLGLMWGNNTLFGAVAAVFIFFAVRWFGWELGFYISAAIYFFGLLVSSPDSQPAPSPGSCAGNRHSGTPFTRSELQAFKMGRGFACPSLFVCNFVPISCKKVLTTVYRMMIAFL